MTTQPTPADELRTAAEKLRKLAMPVAEQHPGPWNVHNPNGYPQAVLSPAADVILCETLDEIDAPKPTAPYIAAMHPGVGLALADWLEAAAHHYECGIRAADDVFRNDPAGRDAFLTTGPGAPSPQALAVARAINA
ncbi:hypothetical protein ACFY2M_19485 [Streptomyces sp. NPDC001276]|uniref:hypothetical protein n=1 Tax=Streptomyces sp. NPDC001276 TaxID=3364555 RepID=UPI00367EEA99